MKKKIGRYFMAAVLCFSCILLFKSANIKANGTEKWYDRNLQTGYEEDSREDLEERCGWRTLKFYLDGQSYIVVDLVLLVAVVALVMILVLERACGI